MRRVRFRVSSPAVLLFALAYFFDGSGVVSAAVPAVLVHEAGHYLALRLCRRRVRSVRVGVLGLALDYAGSLDDRQTIVCAAGGPLAGLLYALVFCTLSRRFLRLSGAVSCALTLFNLLPILPLDGGRIVAALIGEENALRVSQAAAVLLMLGGWLVSAALGAPGLLFAGAFLAASNFRRAAHL